jgi:hypothetical protein
VRGSFFSEMTSGYTSEQEGLSADDRERFTSLTRSDDGLPYGNKALMRAKIIQRKKSMRGFNAPKYRSPMMIKNP